MKETNTTECGVIIGRFMLASLHQAHRDLIETVLAKHSRVIVFLGCSALRNTLRAPLDFKHRKSMLEEIYGSKIEIYPVHDNRSDETWSKNLDKEITNLLPPGQKATLYGSRDSFIKHYHGKFQTIELESEIFISASQVRKDIITNYPSSVDYRAGVIAATGQHYPTAYQTVDVAVMKDDEILLVKKPGENQWRFIGGFSDPASESLEEDAVREVKEETGVDIFKPQYVSSRKIQDWRYFGERDCIKSALFIAEYDGGTPEGADDVEQAKWFKFQEITPADIVPEHLDFLLDLQEYMNPNSLH
jgi:bifunctional NMN adenylyltransferase/nudix hydrolase